MPQHEDLVQISNADICIAMAPLCLIGFLSHRMGLGMESPLLVGVIRSFIQLNILGYVPLHEDAYVPVISIFVSSHIVSFFFSGEQNSN